MQGGKLLTKNIKDLLKQSYNKNLQNINDYDVDTSLSGQRVQVYKHKNSNDAVVVHRGTKGLHDVYNDIKYAIGMDISNSKRLKHAQDIQRKAEEKYGRENISTLGHSLGSLASSSVGKNLHILFCELLVTSYNGWFYLPCQMPPVHNPCPPTALSTALSSPF